MSDEFRTGPLRFRLTDDALVAESAGSDEDRRINLADVVHVRMYIVQGNAVCLVTPSHGKRIDILCKVGSPPEDMEEYSSFMQTLHDAIVTYSPDTKFVAGHMVFFVLFVVSLIGLVALFGLFTMLLVSDKNVDIGKLAPLFSTILLPVIVMATSSRGLPKKYDPVEIPKNVLPGFSG